MNNYLKFAICVLIPFVVGGFSSAFTIEAIPTWYTTIQKPSFNPPNWIFAPVWSTLYVLMGVSFYLVLTHPSSVSKQGAIFAFILQLTLNFFWSLVFFKWHEIGWAFIEIIAMWIAILFMIRRFYLIHPLAAYMNIPYILWVSFASVLNGTIYYLN